MKYSDEDVERLQRYKRIHLKKEELEQPLDQQLDALQKRNRNKWIQLIVNMLAIIFFGYSYYFDITQLGNTFLYILVAVFVINMVLIFYQKKQIRELQDYFRWQINSNGR
jgi:undecaprenyl pyrophosphate phosphatase UppP